MRLPLLLVAASLAATPLRGQTGGDAVSTRVRRAFEPTITTWVGARNFGTRAELTTNGRKVNFSPSLAVGASLSLPMTRRTGLIADLHVAPLAKQAVSGSETDVANFDRVIAVGGTLALEGRLRAQAPVFGFLGATALAAKKPTPGASGTGIEPGAVFGVGFDSPQRDRLGFRAAFTGYLMKPADPGFTLAEAKSIAFDWSIALGARWNLHRAASAGAR